jgi:arylsulfatase A-like enzyme
LVSDHGEELGDHGGWLHDQSAYEELIRVPLIIRFPHDEFAGRRVDGPVSLLDIVPTVMDYLRRPELAANCRGRSLMPLIEGEPLTDDMRVTAGRHNKKKYYRPYKETRGDVNIVVRQGHWKGIWNAEWDRMELYDLQSDPGETTDSSAENPELAQTMRAFAQSQLAQCQAVAMEPVSGKGDDLDEETRRQLETLGYIDSRKTDRETR